MVNVENRTDLFTRKKLERHFNDALMRVIAVEILLGGELSAELVLPTYFRYKNEYTTDDMHRAAEIQQVLTKRDLLFFQDLVIRGSQIIFPSLASLKQWIKDETKCEWCDLDSIDSSITWDYPEYRHNKVKES